MKVEFLRNIKNSSLNQNLISKRQYLSLRGDEFAHFVEKIAPDLIAVYGTSIIKGKVIDRFKNKILNLHLGLSPYYRGSGTLYHPFANSQPYLAGSTFMYLDSGIDTGEIIHQLRIDLGAGKEFHEICFKHLEKAFKTYKRLIENLDNIQAMEITPVEFTNKPRYYFKDSDFTEDSLVRLKNEMNLIRDEDNLTAYKKHENCFPIQSLNFI